MSEWGFGVWELTVFVFVLVVVFFDETAEQHFVEVPIRRFGIDDIAVTDVR